MRKEKTKDHYDVAIVGAGPVGTGLAIDLARRGRTVCLIEKYQVPQRIPKGQNLTQRSGEHLRRWGVSKAIRDATLIPPEYGNQGITAYSTWLSKWHYDWFKRASVREYYFADNERLPQYETERVLRARATSLPGVDLRTGHVYYSHHQNAELVTVTIDNRDNNEQIQINASWLIGCDGARSPVRESAGITQQTDAHSRRMALVTFQSTELDQLLSERFPGCTIFNAIHPDLDGYWQFLGRTDPYGSFFFHAPVAEDSNIDTFDFPALLQRAAGISVSADMEYAGFWDLRFSQATNYRNGRVFVAGDAAHSHPPYGGYGVNLGFEDARNLGWKLDACLAGWGSDLLLDSYSDERHPVFASTRDQFIKQMINSDAAFTAAFNPERDLHAFKSQWNKRALDGQKEVQSYVPHYSGSPIVCGNKDATSGAVGDHSHIAKPGHHLSPLAGSGDGTDLFDKLGQDFCLITIDTDNVPRHGSDLVKLFSHAANKLKVPLQTVTVPHNDDNAALQANFILVRPDEYIAWAGSDFNADAEKILRKSIAATGSSRG